MKVVFRTDASGQIGGGHMMRCLTLAQALRDAGARVAFVMARGDSLWTDPVQSAGFRLYPVSGRPLTPDPEGPAHSNWLTAPWQADARDTTAALRDFGADWLIWDHYGLDARWVGALRAAVGRLRVMAIDDLDDRALGSDLVLDQTRLDCSGRRYPALAALSGPDYATLRPEFAQLRAQALARRNQNPAPRRVLVTMGLADAAGLVPPIVQALLRSGAQAVDIVMGSGAQTLGQVRTLCATAPQLRLHVDTQDMARLMAEADLCIGAGGMTSWERCALGLGALLVPVAENQMGVARALEQAGAARVLPLEGARNPLVLQQAIAQAMTRAQPMGQQAARLCDGQGSARVRAAVLGRLRPVIPADARLLFDWRNRPDIRAASLNTEPLDWPAHLDWINGLAGRDDGVWWIYSEAGNPLGHVNARREADGWWRWGFYIGAGDAPKGAGRRMLALALAELFRRSDCAGLRADVRAENPRSIALHRDLGFRQIESRDGGGQASCVFAA